MAMRQTIGLSLACLMISTGTIAKTPGKNSSPHPGQLQGNMSEPKYGPAQPGSRPAARMLPRARATPTPFHQSAEGPADAYLGPVHTTGKSEIGRAAWYNWVGSRTASGEILDWITPTAAHRSLPLASYAKVTNLDTGRAVVVKINDRGPYRRRFIIDLSPRAAEEIGVVRSGVAAVSVEPVASGRAPSRGTAPASETLLRAPIPRQSLTINQLGSIRGSSGPRRRTRPPQAPRCTWRAPIPRQPPTINRLGSTRGSIGPRRSTRPPQAPRSASRAPIPERSPTINRPGWIRGSSSGEARPMARPSGGITARARSYAPGLRPKYAMSWGRGVQSGLLGHSLVRPDISSP